VSDPTSQTAEQAAPQGLVSAQTETAPAPPRPTRVAWLLPAGIQERLERVLLPLAIGLLDEFVELVLVCPSEVEVGQLPCPPAKVVTSRRPHWWVPRKRFLRELAGHLRSLGVDLLHAMDASTAGLARHLARWSNTVYIVSSYELGDGRRLGTLDDRALAVLATSSAIQSHLLECHVSSAERIHLLRPGVYRVRHATCFKELDATVAIVASGPFDRLDWYDTLLQSFAELRARGYDCVYLIIGSGKAAKRLHARTSQLHLSHAVTFVERQPARQLTGIFKAADIYISAVPSRAVDIHCLLAMAAGVPVLATGDGATDFLLDGETAVLFKPGDSAELAVKVAALLDDRASARALVENALRYLREHHSPAKMVTALAEVYRRCLSADT
jgi:glycosyltransferase involved in cell wall biosynthesis